MSIQGYLTVLKERLLSDPKVAGFQIQRERSLASDGYWRGTIVFSDRSWLEFSEYFQIITGETVQIITYRFHWAKENGDCIKRWDNAPHHPELAGYPHHVHLGTAASLSTSRPRSLSDVLDEILSEVGN